MVHQSRNAAHYLPYAKSELSASAELTYFWTECASGSAAGDRAGSSFREPGAPTGF
jgi:hypothetical protein